MPRHSFDDRFDGTPNDWSLLRLSEKTVLDKDSNQVQVASNQQAILGGEWDGTDFVPNANSVGIDLNNYSIDESDLNLTIETDGDSISAYAANKNMTQWENSFCFQLGYILRETPPAGGAIIFSVNTGPQPVVRVVTDSAYVYVDIPGVDYHSFLLSGFDLDIRVRFSAPSNFTTWINGQRKDTYDIDKLVTAPTQYLCGDTPHTTGFGALRRIRWHDTARPYSMIEGWPV